MVVLFGAAFSVYVRIARLALAEKRVAYCLHEVDVFAPDGPDGGYLQHHPFGRMPAFEHDGFRLYETAAITRYVDEAFAGPPLQPGTARERARMMQAIGILDSYAYRPMIWDVFVERVRAPAQGRRSDEDRIRAGLARAQTCLTALSDILGAGTWFGGARPSLADLHAAPNFAYFTMAPEGRAALALHPPLQVWWQRMAARPAMTATRSPFEAP